MITFTPEKAPTDESNHLTLEQNVTEAIPTRKRRAQGNPETKSLLDGFHEEQSKASLIGDFMLPRGVRRFK